MRSTSLARWSGCLLGTGGGLILMVLLGGFYVWLYRHHTEQVLAARATEAAQDVILDSSPTAALGLPASGLWTAICTKRPCAGCTGEWTWTLSMNLRARSFESRAEYRLSEVGQGGWLYTTHLVHQGLGVITEDGMLHGPYHESTTLGFSKGGVAGKPQVLELDGNMYGAISNDLNSICISRGEDPGNYDIDYIRRIGREAFFGPDMGCEAECAVTQSP